MSANDKKIRAWLALARRFEKSSCSLFLLLDDGAGFSDANLDATDEAARRIQSVLSDMSPLVDSTPVDVSLTRLVVAASGEGRLVKRILDVDLLDTTVIED